MSFLPLSNLASVDVTLGTRAVPVAGEATEPAVVRNGSAAAKHAYQEGLAFEQVLVKELAQELTSTVSSSSSGSSGNDGSDDGSGDGPGAASGLLGSGAASGYESMIPGALTTALMSAGGTGLALELAHAIDPSAFAGHADSRGAAAPASATTVAGSSRKETK